MQKIPFYTGIYRAAETNQPGLTLSKNLFMVSLKLNCENWSIFSTSFVVVKKTCFYLLCLPHVFSLVGA